MYTPVIPKLSSRLRSKIPKTFARTYEVHFISFESNHNYSFATYAHRYKIFGYTNDEKFTFYDLVTSSM